MYHKRTNRLVEICPQCCREVDTASARLVSDVCGHSKCRVCLLQEMNGCLKCARDSGKTLPPSTSAPPPPRKSVITSTVSLQKIDPVETTNKIIEESMKEDKLFPKDIAKQSTGNCFHLKRLISERFFSERKNKKDKSFTADISNEVLSTNESNSKLPGHIQYFCNVHKVALTDEASIEQHMSCSPESIFKCCNCDKSFSNAYKLKRHSRSHKLSTNYECSECKKKFKDNYALTTHLRKHTGAKLYSCQLCNLQLSQLWSFKRHIAKHKGERNFVCDSCDRRFLTKTELHRHQATHSKTKPYACRICGARFTFQRSLVRHAAVHSEQSRLLQCPACDSTFKRKDNLHRHLRNNHRETLAGDCQVT